MADQTPVVDEPKPSDEDIKQANAAEEAKWNGDFKEEDLTVPYKKEVEDDQDDTTDEDDSDDKSTDEPEGDDGDEPEVVETHTEPAPVITVEDPGEYEPADYSFEVTLADGKTVTINTPEEADKIAEDPENFKKPKELLDFITKTTSMRNRLDKDFEGWQDRKNTYDIQVEEQLERQQTVENMVSEFDYLVSKGMLPAVPKEYKDADWNDPQVAKQPGVKEQIELINYMTKENEIRAKAKVQPLTSMVDAFNAWSLDTNRQKQAEAKREAGEARKVAGAKVAGVSPAQTGAYVPKGIAVGNPSVLKRGQAVWDN